MRSLVVRVDRTRLKLPSLVGGARNRYLPTLREGAIVAVVCVAEVRNERLRSPRARHAPWVPLLQLHIRQQHQVIEELVVKQAETVDVRTGVVLLEQIGVVLLVLQTGD